MAVYAPDGPNEPQEDSALNVDADPDGTLTLASGNPVNNKASALVPEE